MEYSDSDNVSRIEIMRGALFDLIYILIMAGLYQHLSMVMKKIQHYYKVISFDDDQILTKCAVDEDFAYMNPNIGSNIRLGSQSKYFKSNQSGNGMMFNNSQILRNLYKSGRSLNPAYFTLVRRSQQ